MSLSVGLEAFNNSKKATEYTVQTRSGCTLIFGSIGVGHLAALAKSQPIEAVMSGHVARLAGCSVAFGLPADLKTLEEELVPHALARCMSRYASTGLPPDAIRWLCIGRRGQSADAMFFILTGVNPGDIDTSRLDAHPHDPGDLGRCRLLLEAVPSLSDQIQTMADVSPEWARLIEQWHVLCAAMDEEAPQWRSGVGATPKTRDLIKIALGPSKSQNARERNPTGAQSSP